MIQAIIDGGFEFIEVEVLKEDLRFGIAKGDICIALSKANDPEMLTIEWRQKDHYGPFCDVYRDEVKILNFPFIDRGEQK